MNVSHVQLPRGGAHQDRNEFDDNSASHTVSWLVRNIHSNSVCIAILDTAHRGPCQVMKPVDAIKQTLVKQGFSQPVKDYEEKLLDVGTKVRYLYEPGKLEGQQYRGERRKRSTDPMWSLDGYKIKDRYVQKHQPTLYYLDGGPKRSFVFKELQKIQSP